VCAPFCCSHCCACCCCCCCGFDLCARLIVVKKWKSTAATTTKGKINPAKAAAVKWWAAAAAASAEEVAVGRREAKKRWGEREEGEGRELLGRLCGRLMWLPSWLNFIFVACMPGFGYCGARVQPDDLHSKEKRTSNEEREERRGSRLEWNGMVAAASTTEPQSFGRFCIFSCSFAVWWFLAGGDNVRSAHSGINEEIILNT